MAFGLDWAWGSISPAALKGVGASFACRYLSHDPSKNLTPAEASRLSRAGIDIVVVWETTANRAAQGHAAGVADAQEAHRQAKACGKPDHAPIFFAVDFDGTIEQVRPYFEGVSSVLGKGRRGAYGSVRIIYALFDFGLIDYGWQTYAWSGGRWEKRAHLRQYSNGHTVAGVGCDYNRSTSSHFGQWRVGQAEPRPDPLRYLSAEERRWVRSSDAVMAKLVARRKRIWRRAQPKAKGGDGRGWDAFHRRQRYAILKAKTRGH